MFGNPVEQYSPCKQFRLTIHNFEEPRMGYNVCKFYLTDLRTNETIDFEPLWAIGIGQNGLTWSENEKFLMLPVAGHPIESFFIYNIENETFTYLNFNNCWLLNGYCHDDYIEIEYDEKFESDHQKYPTKVFSKPPNLHFDFTELKWIDLTNINEFEALRRNDIVIDFKPIYLGWRPFKGQLPQSTEVIVWELKKFAEYGDTQSLDWLSEIADKAVDIDDWSKASRYLGVRQRK